MVFRLQTLKKRADFLRARNGRYCAMPGLVLQASRVMDQKPTDDDGPYVSQDMARFGFTATKKLGNAVVRNRVKRRLREAVRLIAPQKAHPDCEYVLIGRKSTLKRPFSSLLQDLTIAFARVHDRRVHKKRVQGSKGSNRKNQGRRQKAHPRATSHE